MIYKHACFDIPTMTPAVLFSRNQCFYVQHLGSIWLAVGRLPCEDEHAAEEIPSGECGRRASLDKVRGSDGKPAAAVDFGSFAEMNLA
jgi:hypothetical protein